MTRPRFDLFRCLLEDLGRAHWTAARLPHVVRGRYGQLTGAPSDGLFEETLGRAIDKLCQQAASHDRTDIVDWCKQTGRPANDMRNGLVHSIAFTAKDGKQALRGSKGVRPVRYRSEEILDVADTLIAANGSIPRVQRALVRGACAWSSKAMTAG